MKPRFSFVLSGAGWAEIEIVAGDQRIHIPRISYLSDALDDVLRMGVDVAIGRGCGLAQFFHEPGSTVLVAETAWWKDNDWERGARLSTFSGGDYGDSKPNWDQVDETARSSVVQLSSAEELLALIRDAGREALQQYGVEGYAEIWNGSVGFPLKALRALEAAIEDSGVR